MKKMWLLFGIVLIVFIALFINIEDWSKSERDYPRSFSQVSPDEYVQLFKESVRKNLLSQKTVTIKGRNPISSFVYSKDYYIQVYKLAKGFSGVLNNVLKESHEDDPGYGNSTYDLIEQNCAEFRYKLDDPGKTSMVYFNYFGNNYNVLSRSDSVACFYIDFKNLAIKYRQDAANDIYVQAKLGGLGKKSTPIEILFLKRHANLYLLFMSVNGTNTKLERSMLYDLIF